MSHVTFATFVVAVAVSLAGTLWCPVPWAPGLLAGATLVAVIAWRSRRDGLKIALGNIAALLVAFAAFEAYLGYAERAGDPTVLEGTITEGFTHPDDVLGYAPQRGARVTARKRFGNSVLYDVVYTIGDDGLRIRPNATEMAVDGCVVFFGDSVTFGEGVNDDQAFPYRVAAESQPGVIAYNFAFSGYGPHQMLSALQSDRIILDSRCASVRFIYLAIPEHIARVAGLTSWDVHGPRFRVDAMQRVVRDGNFDDPRRLFGWTLPRWVDDALASCRTWQRFFGRARDPGPPEMALFVAVVRDSARNARAKFPGSGFQVLMWDARDDARIDSVEAQLEAAGVPVYRVTRAIPDLKSHQEQYVISQHDPHPNALQHERIAEYVVRTMLDPGSRH